MKNRKFTWIDGLALVVVLGLVLGTCARFVLSDAGETKKNGDTFQYTLKIDGVRQVTVDALQVGDTVYNNDGKAQVGVISQIQVSDAETTIEQEDGTIAEGKILDRYDVVLTLTAEGTRKDGEYRIGTYTIKVNQLADYYTKYCAWSANVTSVN